MEKDRVRKRGRDDRGGRWRVGWSGRRRKRTRISLGSLGQYPAVDLYPVPLAEQSDLEMQSPLVTPILHVLPVGLGAGFSSIVGLVQHCCDRMVRRTRQEGNAKEPSTYKDLVRIV